MTEKTARPWLWIGLGFLVSAKVWVLTLLKQDWRPIADEAVIAEISAGILQGNFPWLGMRSTGFAELPGLQLYHPGPIQFYLLSVAQAITDLHPLGLLTASALLFVVVVILGMRGAWQAAKWWGLIPAAVTFAALAFTSQDVLIQILNTQPARVAIPAALMTAWAVACGRKNALYPFIFTASIAAQVQVAALPVILILVVTLIFLMWRNGGPVPEKSTLWFSGLLFVILWAGPIVDIIVSQPSNFTEFLRYITLDSQKEIALTPAQLTAGRNLLWTVPIALVVSWLIVWRSSERVRPGLANSLAVGLQLSAPIVVFIGYQLLTQTSPARRVQAMFGMGVAYFMVGLTLLTLVAWIYQAANERNDETTTLRSLSVGIGLAVLTVAVFMRSDLVNEALIFLAVIVMASSLGTAGTALGIHTLTLPRLAVVGLSLSMGLVWILGITNPQPSHEGSLESSPETIRLTDEIAAWIHETGSELPVEIRGSQNWNIGLYLAPTLNYELITKGRESHFIHPWSFEKDHKRPGINVPEGERILLILESPSGFDKATKDLGGEPLKRETFETNILNDGEVIEVLMLHMR